MRGLDCPPYAASGASARRARTALTPFCVLVRITLIATTAEPPAMLVRRSFLLLLSSLALAGCGTPPVARAAGHLVSVQIVDRSRGEVLTEHRHRGNRWVAGRPGER